MPTNKWRLTIDLDDLWDDPAGPPMQRREQIAARLRESGWFRLTPEPHRLAYLLDQLVTADRADADVWWNALYDMADDDMVFLDIFGMERLRRERAEKATNRT